MKKKPNFFLVGYPKCATTSLHTVLKQHPDIYLPERKEPNFFCKEYVYEQLKHSKSILKHFYIDEEGQYLDMYSDASSELVLGDISPNTGISLEAARRIYDFNPMAKILIIYREPVGFLHALHSARLASRFEREENFVKALKLERERKKETKISFNHYFEWINYSNLLKSYLRVFPRENIKVMLFEQFKADNMRYLSEILNFLEISKCQDLEIPHENVSKRLRGTVLRDFLHEILNHWDLSKFLKTKFARKLAEVYFNVVLVESKRPQLPQEVTIALKKKFYPEVVKFQDLLLAENFIQKDFSITQLWEYDDLF